MANIGALASKPVMEGKAVLFKRFADVDGSIWRSTPAMSTRFVNCVTLLGPTFGGINLEDIKAPECFIIEQRLRELMDIPVFHDDQHGTAIICRGRPDQRAALTGRDIRGHQVGDQRCRAAAIACIESVKAMGCPMTVILCDSRGSSIRAVTLA